MSFVSRFVVLTAFSMAFIVTPVLAGEGGVSTSYSKKKQGMVHFVEEKADSEQEEAANENAEASSEAQAAQAIEPAAGESEDASAEQDNPVAEMIKLPRK